MEPIDYLNALLRRWPIPVVFALVGAVVGLLLPVHAAKGSSLTHWQASSLVGVTPGGTNASNPNNANQGSGLGGGPISTSQLAYFATDQSVITNAARMAGVNLPTSVLLQDFSVNNGKTAGSSKGTKKSSGPSANGTVTLSVKQRHRDVAARLANAYAQSLGQYVNQQLASKHQTALNQANAKVTSLQSQLANVSDQIASQVGSNPTSAATKNSDPQLAQLESQASSLSSSLGVATAQAAVLSQSGPPPSGYTILQPASASRATEIPANVSLLSHRSVRAPIGFVIGFLLGVGFVLLLETLDNRLKSVKSAQEAFGLPVIGQIPRTPTRAADPNLVVAIAPASPISEAYRMLRIAVERAPLSVLSRASSNGTASAVTPEAGRPSTSGPTGEPPDGGGGALTAREPSDTGVTSVAVAPHGDGALTEADPGKRNVVLVVSPGVEPTRAELVANLAAVYAETGKRVLVITTEDLRRPSDDARQPNALPTDPGRHLPGSYDRDQLAAKAKPARIPGVRILPLGQVLLGPGQLSSHVPAVLSAAREMADVVIVESPSLLMAHDAEALVPEVDLVVPVGEINETTTDEASRSTALLRRISAPIAGVAVTSVNLSRRDRRAAVRTARGTYDVEVGMGDQLQLSG